MNAFEAIVKLIADPASLKDLQSQINGKDFTAKVKADTTQAQKAVSDLARQTRVNSMQAWADNNSKAMKKYGGEINGIIDKMRSSGTMTRAEFDKLNTQFKTVQNQARITGDLGKTFGDKMKTAWQKFGQWGMATRSMMFLWNEFKNGINLIKDLDSALTNINYTMNVSKTQLSDIGNSSIQMAKDLKTSAKNVLEAVTLYANAKETADSVLKKSETAIMLSNVTGMTGSQSAKMLQSVMNQFDLTQEDLTYISDTIQSVSQNMAYDFSTGIQEISEGIERSGSVAKSAGLDLEQYASMLGLVIEKTGLGGDTIGNAYRTIFQRITKASTTEGTLEEDISAAEKSLRDVGVEVRSSEGEFRNLNDIMKDLGDRWKDLNDVQQSNISYNVAGIRQTNILKTLLTYWTDYENLVAKAGDSAGTTMKNQEKYAESYKGELADLSATAESFWNNFLNSSVFKTGTNFLTGILSLLDKITDKAGLLGTVGLGAGIFAGFKNFGGHKILEPHKTIVLKLPNIISVLWDTKVFLWSNVKYTW